MTTDGPRRRRLSFKCRKLLDSKAKARTKARAQATCRKAKKNDLMDDIQFHHADVNFAHSPVAAAEVDDLSSALQLMAVAEKAADHTITGFFMTIAENELHQNLQKSPFLKLPPEVRCLIYEQVLLDIVEGAEAVAFTRQAADRAYQSTLIQGQVNVLPHTCRIIRKECAPIYEKFSLLANHFRINTLEDLVLLDPSFIGDPWIRSQQLEDYIHLETDARLARGLGMPWDESQVTAAVCNMRAVGDIDRVVMFIEENIKKSIAENIAEKIAESKRRRSQKIIEATKVIVWEVCIRVQDSLHDGAGVRKAMEDELKPLLRKEVPHRYVTGLIIYYVRCCSNFEIAQRVDKRVRAPASGRVLKREWRKPRMRSKKSYRLPDTGSRNDE